MTLYCWEIATKAKPSRGLRGN